MSLYIFSSTTLGFFKPYWKQVVIIFLALLFQAAFRVLLPLGYSKVFDKGIAQSDSHYVWQILILLAFAWLINLTAGLVQDRYIASSGTSVLNDLRLKMFTHLQSLPPSYHDERDSGDLMSLFTNDLAAIETAYLRALLTAIFSGIVLVASVILLFAIEWRLALITFASLPIALIGPRILGKLAQKENYQRKNYEAKVSSSINENIGAATMVKAFGLQKLKLDSFKIHLEELAARIKKAFVIAALMGRTSSQTIQLVQIGIMGFGAYLSINGHLSIGSLIGFLALLLNISNAANYISSSLPDLLPASGALQRINEFLNSASSGNKVLHNAQFPSFQELRFDEVCFSYQKGSLKILNEISFSIPAGSSVAIVGPSGCGKSTILNLILRFYQADSGKITFDQINLNSITEDSLRKKVSVVMQDTVLFNSSFRENICMGASGISQSQLERVAQQAEIHDFISSLEHGYETPVGEWGGNLSGGQRQRIAIARAMLREPSLLVLDEATSALDPSTEEAVNQTLKHFAVGRTVISSTHRLRAITGADLILVVSDGRVAEQGSHDELLANRGLYKNLWEKQSGLSFSTEHGVAEVKPERLRNIPLLEQLSKKRLNTIAEQFVTESFPPDRIVFMKGDLGEKFYIIVRGTVEIDHEDQSSDGSKTQLLQDGDYFGEMALLDHSPRNASVRTLANTILLSLDRHQFQRLLDDEPELHKTLKFEALQRRKKGLIF